MPTAAITSRRGGARSAWRADPSGEAYQRMRLEVVEAAEQAINEVGISKLRIGHVATLAGCTRQNLYRYFESKQELVAAVLLRRSTRLGHHVVRLVGAIDDPEERLLEGVLEAVRVASRDRYLRSYFAGPSAGEMARFLSGSHALVESIRPLLDGFFATSPRWVRSDLSRDEFAECLSRTFLAELAWGTHSERSRARRKHYLRKTLVPAITGRVSSHHRQGRGRQ